MQLTEPGSPRGIGRASAIELGRLGYDLVVNHRSDSQSAQKTANDCLSEAGKNQKQIRVAVSAGNVQSADDRRSILTMAQSEFGRLDLLVIKAGMAPRERADLLQTGDDEFGRSNANDAGSGQGLDFCWSQAPATLRES